MRRVAAAVLAVCCALTAPGMAAPTEVIVASTAVPPMLMQRAQGYVDAVNGGDAAAVEAFRARDSALDVNAAIPAAVFIDYFANQKRVTGGLTLVSARMAGADRLEVLVRDQLYGALHGVILTLDATAERRVSLLDPGPAPAWAAEDGPRLSESEVAARVRTDVAKGCRAGVFSGAVLLARGDKVLFETACGEASRRFHVKNTVETKINLGSINKMFTAVAVMQLAEAGKVELDAPVSRYLDETWLPKAVADRVTIRQLLTHRSGLGDFFGAEYRKAPTAFKAVGDYKPLLVGLTPAFEPGSQFQYSNGGMMLLGAVIEAASGERYDDYLARHVFAPAGMTATGDYAADDPVENLAMGYTPAPWARGGWRETFYSQLYHGGPAGGGYSTVRDLFRFARALETGRLVSAASRAFLWADHAPDNYGAGFEIRDTNAGKVVGHTGFLWGVSARLSLFLDRGYVAVVLANVEVGAPTLMDVIGDEVGRGR